MKKNHKNRPKKPVQLNAFTIIEVLIVMAIAILILLMVFLAVPSLKKTARDHARKDLVKRLFVAEQVFYGERSRYPACDSFVTGCTALDEANALDFIKNFFPDGLDVSTSLPYSQDTLITNPAGSIRTDTNSFIYLYNSGLVDHNITPELDQIIIANGHWCYNTKPDGQGTILVGAGQNLSNFAILIGIERGPYYCLDNG